MRKISALTLLASCLFFVSMKNAGGQEAAKDSNQLEALQWRNIGPFRGGRSNAVCGVPGNDQLYYAGYTGGGIWKTEDAGLTWRNISDGFLKTGSVGDIAVAPSDPNVIYAGMGEHAVRGVMTSYGDGVYRSTDGGKTWQNIGLKATRHISDVVVHPDDPETVFVAAQGAVHGPSEARGIYKTTDGGKNWRQVLYIDENTGASSLRFDPANPRILYAATWEHRRYPWKVESGGPGSAIWKSTDNGENWEQITEGLPGELGKIGLAVSPANPERVFAIVEAEKSKAGLYRSDDGGRSWELLCNDQDLTARSWYYMEVFADPQNADVVYVLNAPMLRSIDGGKTFSRLQVGHGDTHDLWINPHDNRNMILGNDGGAELTFNGGRSWSSLNNQPTAQFYRVNADRQFPYRVYGGQQDNSSVVIASRTGGIGITEKDWEPGPGCESAFIAFDPDNPERLYGGCYQGLIDVLDTRTGKDKDIMQYPSLNLAAEPKDMKYRFNWNAPIVASPHDPDLIYHAGNRVFQTTDGGLSWTTISPDLTRNDTTRQGRGGGPLTNEGAGGENYNTLSYLIESPLEPGVIYTGSDCGLVHVTRDGGQNWRDITPPDLPECLIHAIDVSPHAAGTAYVCATRYKFNDLRSMVYKTTDYGASWQGVNDGVEADDFIKVVREDPKTPGLLYGGAERGFYISYDGGAQWRRRQLNLPVVPVNDLIINDNDLIAATQGRAFWILDDLGPLQQSKGVFDEETIALYLPKPTVRFTSYAPSWRPKPSNVGENPKNGVILTYFLPEAADSNRLQLEILDAQGKVIRTYSNQQAENFKRYPGGPPPPQLLPAKAGLNRFAWDFRTETLPGIPEVYIYGSYQGRQVAPGNYQARLTYGDQVATAGIEILPDPRLETAGADWAGQQEVLALLENRITEMHRAVNTMYQLKEQIEGYNKVMREKEEMKDLVKAGKDLIEQIDAWEATVVERRQKSVQDVINWPGKLNAEYFALRGKVDTHDPRITQGVRDRLADLEAQWAAAKRAMESLKQKEVAAYNRMFREREVPALIVEKEEVKR